MDCMEGACTIGELSGGSSPKLEEASEEPSSACSAILRSARVHQHLRLLNCFLDRSAVPGLEPSRLSHAIRFVALLHDSAKSCSKDNGRSLPPVLGLLLEATERGLCHCEDAVAAVPGRRVLDRLQLTQLLPAKLMILPC
mmetsp:Transcript_27223/g.63909  ORF Transcript_27223/g.63909 Transcript_27223/m.63909 type:complete len:140 (+) Transcript_27223:2678-3097(+)